jgi:hypothetical protein
MSLGTTNASGVGTTLKDFKFHNHGNIIDSRNVLFAERVLQGLAGHIYNPAHCVLRKKCRHVIALMLTL